MSDQEKGVYRKYEVKRLNDSTGKHNLCNFFVLDLVHDKFANAALTAYANACATEYPQLADHIRYLIEDCPTCKNQGDPSFCSDAHHYIPPSGTTIE